MNRKIRLKAFLISFLLAAAASAVAFCAYFALRERDSMTVKEPVSVYINGERIRFENGARLLRRDARTKCDNGREIQDIENYPLLTDGGDIILQKSFSWNKIAGSGIYRVDYFTRLTYQNGKVRMEKRDGSAEAADGFLYDNQDVYIFLEPVTLYIGGEDGKQVKLDPMSVVQCVTNFRWMQIYGAGKEPVLLDELENLEVVAVFSNKRKVDLASDLYYMENGAWRLLFMPLESLNGMEREAERSEKK